MSPNNQNDVAGQVLANSAILHRVTPRCRPLRVPGAGSIEGLDQNVVYIREIVA